MTTTLETIDCRICGTPFERTVGGRGRPALYCKDDCRKEARRQRRNAGKHPSADRSHHKVRVLDKRPGDFLTPKQVAAMYGVTIKTVRLWANAGKIPSELTPGGHRRYPRSAFPANEIPAPPIVMPRRHRLTPGIVDPRQNLVARVDLGNRTGLFLVTPDTTWGELGGTIATAFFCDDDHLYDFWVPQDGKPRRGMWDDRVWLPLWSTRADLYRCWHDEWQWDPPFDDVNRSDRSETKVTRTVGHGWATQFNFDMGAEWWLDIRFHRTPPFPPDTDPVLIAPEWLDWDHQYGHLRWEV